MTRALRNPNGTTSLFRFLHTSGGMTTESFPASCTVLDEVQGMESADIDKVRARMGDSDMQFTLMLSTPNHSGLDINEWYLRGHQAVWHTRCMHCEALSDLSDPAGIFPDRSIVFNAGQINGAPVDEYCWICPVCQQFILDPQRGEYVSQNPSADPRIRSFLLPRTISPRITARDAIVGWNRAKGGDAKKSFYNRTLARPYVNVDELPVTLSLCEACVEEGRLAGIEWQTSGSGCVAGIDNMGSHNVICVLKRHTDGRPALVYAEDIWDIEPYNRCSEIMDQFGITCCVTESLPNYNSAMAFARRHPGRVFTAGYGELRDQMLIWGDDPLNRSQRHTDEGSRNRYTVVLNQYRCMMQALHRIKDRAVLFPDPSKLEQMVPDGDGGWKRTPILYDMFGDFTRTALVVQEDPDTRKRRARVIKIGADPHHSYSWMCASVAWARVHGATQWILPGEAAATREPEPIAAVVERCMPGLPRGILALIEDGPISVCGRCREFDLGAGLCTLRGLSGTASDPSCDLFERR